MYGWSSRRDLRDEGPWRQFRKDMHLVARQPHPVQDALAAILIAVAAVGSVAIVARFLLRVAGLFE